MSVQGQGPFGGNQPSRKVGAGFGSRMGIGVGQLCIFWSW